jgi:hypothetical protein
MTATIIEPLKDGEPERSRAVFSQQDFGLIRAAIWHYLQDRPEDAERNKYSNLYHRLGRVT